MAQSVAGRSWSLLPHSRRGRQALFLLFVAVGCFAAFSVLVASGQRGGDTFFSNWWLAGTILPAAASAIAAGAVGTVAMVRDRDRALSSVVAAMVGVLVLVFVVGEIAFPH